MYNIYRCIQGGTFKVLQAIISESTHYNKNVSDKSYLTRRRI